MRVGLIAFGHLHVITGGNLYDRKLVAHLRECGDEVIILPVRRKIYALHLLDNLAPGLYRRLIGLPIDLLLQDEANHPSLFLLNRRLRNKVGYPVVAIVHHLFSNERHVDGFHPLYEAVEKRYLEGVDGFIFASQATARSVGGLIHRPAPGVVANPAADPFNQRPTEAEILDRAWRPGPLRVLFVGNIIPRKGIQYLCAALAQLPADLVQLTVVGDQAADAHYARSLEQGVAKSGLSGRVRFLGKVSAAQLEAAYRSHQVLAVPSQHEGFGIVYLEGLQCGLPALAAAEGGASEVITQGENGFLIAPGDVEAIKTALLDLATHRQTLAAMSLAASRCFDRFPSWEQTGAKIREFLAQRLAHGPEGKAG